MNLVHDDLAAMIEAVEILSPDRYVLLGEPRDAADRLAERLAEDLYERLYLRPTMRSLTRPDVLASRDLMAALSAVNAGRGHRQSGWSIRRVAEDARIVVERRGLAFWAAAVAVHVEGSIRSGEPCRVSVPGEVRRLTEGFYVALGDADDDDPAGGLIRCYWHLMSVAAVPFVAAATSQLNAAGVPFRLKVIRNPGEFHRADAGVIYVRRRHGSRAAAVIGRIHAGLASGLRPEVPLLTRRLADGLGYSEGPPTSSFGRHRCGLVAEALRESFERGEIGCEERAATMASAFLREGLDPLRPHLDPDGRELGDVRISPVRSRAATRPGLSPIEAATRIGRSICRGAYWERGRRACNWIGRSSAEFVEPGGRIVPAADALGPDLYGGSAGIALFQTHLYSMTGVDDFRRVALAGIAHSLDRFEAAPPRPPLSALSFFSGDLGSAYAARRIGALVSSPELVPRAGDTLRRVVEAAGGPHMLDVIGGNAGAIPALLELGHEPGWEYCRDLAVALGEELCRAGAGPLAEGAGEAAAKPNSFTAAGLAHGAAGIGLALYELHAATGRPEFREAARRTFDREDTLFIRERGNWVRMDHRSHPPRFEVAWCHGAAGIALARCRAAGLDFDRGEAYRAMARLAIATTLATLDRGLTSPRCDASSCHGMGGLIEIVWIAARMLDDASYRDKALSATQVLIDHYSESGDWPSGLHSGGLNPSLMLGTAGIGYTFLRLHDPDRVPSLLWIGC
jgi:hypothetical protein